MKLTKKEVLNRFQRRMNGDYEFRVSQSFVVSKYAAKKMKIKDLKDAIHQQLSKMRQSLEASFHKIAKDLDL